MDLPAFSQDKRLTATEVMTDWADKRSALLAEHGLCDCFPFRCFGGCTQHGDTAGSVPMAKLGVESAHPYLVHTAVPQVIGIDVPGEPSEAAILAAIDRSLEQTGERNRLSMPQELYAKMTKILESNP
jgi:hypothetical protein